MLLIWVGMGWLLAPASLPRFSVEAKAIFRAILGGSSNLEKNMFRVSVDELLTLLVSIHSQDTDSILSQDSDRALPIACLANTPIEVLRFLSGKTRRRFT